MNRSVLRRLSNRHPRLSGLVAAGLVAGLLVAGTAAPASAGTAREVGRGLVVVGTNLLYMPTKLVYATGGALVSGVAWLFSGGDAEVAGPIAASSLRGDYVVTLDHLDRKDRLEFIGRTDAQRQAEERARWGEEQVSTWDGSSQEGF
ncbi:MAG: hypothetical protein QNK05_03965 [Myxococcota bacterium]|nr:hypothetical protein [Myxococcota bacterium]